MGFDVSDLQFLLSAKRMGFKGNSVCTLGKLNLFLTQRQISATLKRFSAPDFLMPSSKSIYFADDVMRPLGFSEIETMDASDYEGATLIHDLNHPIPNHWNEKFDMVWDGGTLEHIFDFSQAIENAMRLVKVGGIFVSRTPANNFCGHGFYQFSPELFFRLFNPDNGFEIVRLYIVCDGKHYHVADPAIVHGRVELLSSTPAFLMVHAKKNTSVPSQLRIPQQSDYLTAWEDRSSERRDGRLKALLRSRLSPSTIAEISYALNRMRQRRHVWQWKRGSRLSNRSFYRPVQNWDQATSSAFASD